MSSHEKFDWPELRRREFPGLADSAYLNAASMGPLPVRSRAAIDRFNDRRGHVQEMTVDDFLGPPAAAREQCARLIHADPAEIALGTNTSFGINLAATGLDLPNGSTVIVSDREFPANVYPWMRRPGYNLEVVPADSHGWPDEEALLRRIASSDVSLLALSSVQFSDGYRADLDRIGEACRESGTILVVDAIQSLGGIPLDVRRTPVDIVATGAHKWLLGPLGTGFTYIRSEIQDRLVPVDVAWTGMKASAEIDHVIDYRFDFVDDARRFEGATAPLQGYRGLAASLELLLEVGVDRIWDRVDSLLQPLREFILATDGIECRSPTEPDRRSTILAFFTPNQATVYNRLKSAGIVTAVREGSLRIAPHLYNTEDDIQRVIDVLERMRGGGWT